MTEAPRPLYWSVRRELWENRAVTIAPPVAAAVFLFAYLLSTVRLPMRMAAALAADPAKQRALIEQPYTFVSGLMMVMAFFIGFFYCLDALYGERRDRSILFWKSLPVSDRTTVLAKASIPLVILPLIVYPIAVVTRLIMLAVSSMVLAQNSRALAALWSNVTFVQSSVAMLYALVIAALWHAPLYAWLLVVSAWAKRAAFLWAVLPPMLLMMFEGMAFGTRFFYGVFSHRIAGWATSGFDMHAPKPVDPLQAMTPGRFLSEPGLWIGFLFAAAFLAVAVSLRRNREPI